jgi:hypothetical protein
MLKNQLMEALMCVFYDTVARVQELISSRAKLN